MSESVYYYILEHPRRGCLKDLEETAAGRTGRFTIEGLRNQSMRFHTPEQADAARRRLPALIAAETQIRCSQGDGTFMGAWPVVVFPEPQPAPPPEPEPEPVDYQEEYGRLHNWLAHEHPMILSDYLMERGREIRERAR